VDIFKTLTNPGSSDSGTYLYVNIKNIDFINLVLAGASFLGIGIGSSYTGNYQQVNINSCRFVGRRDRYLVRTVDNPRSTNNAINYTSCFFNVAYKPSGGTANTYVPINQVWAYDGTNRCFANYCRFKEAYGGWTIGQFAPTIAVAPQCSTHNLYLNGCYIYGTIVTGYDAVGISNHYSYNSTLQNVVDADLYVTDGGSAGSSINVYAPKGIYRNKITKWNTTPEIAYVDNNQNANAISVPPDKMTDADYLYAHGFDIVV
jgi:hypothetical protein